ncbi:MAG: DUF5714 domain-containing protein [Bacteroidales bacterium]
MEKKAGCLICGEELIYFDTPQLLKCEYCGKEIEATVSCSANHFICDKCHSMGAIEFASNYCINTHEQNPLEIINSMMKHPSVKMHGPEHHFLVPASLLTAYANFTKKTENLCQWLETAKKRAEIVPGGVCGSHGNCGAAVGTGIFLSILLGSTPLKSEKWGQCNYLTGKSLIKIGEIGGPRCCKRDSFLSIIEAVDFVNEKMNLNWEIEKSRKCYFKNLNKQCIKEKCPFY